MNPRVSIGIPVWNGENYLAEAIQSVLDQTFDEFELVVCDNASTDRTRDILADFAARDRRVRVLANPRNLGAAANYNRVFSESRGTYFKWLAHDDRMHPQYLEKAVAVLDARPEVVLVNSLVEYIDGAGRPIGIYDSGLALADHPSAVRRFASLVLRSHSCVDFFGLLRRRAMSGSLLHAPFHGADRAFLAQMALRGRFAQIAEPLVQMREHPNRYTRRARRVAERARWHDASLRGRFVFPTWRLYRHYLSLAVHERLTPQERAGVFAVLIAWWGCNWNAVRAIADLAEALLPGFTGFAEQVKYRLFGPAPGHFL